jgi:hypothetical protein
MSEGPVGTTENDMTLPGATGEDEPVVIRLSDILTQQASAEQTETDDRAKLGPLVTPDVNDIRPKLIAWAAQQFRSPCYLVNAALNIPNPCSDGQSRKIFQYIEFLTGKTLETHIAGLQAILPDLSVFYVQEGSTMKIGVVRR